MAGRVQRAGVRRVHEPATVGGATQYPRGVEEDAAEQEQPEAESVDAGERNVAGTDLQRQEVVGERGGHGHDEQEHHGGGVHREHLVVQVGVEHGVVGGCQLQPDEQRFHATHQEEEQRHDAVHDAQLLVVDREDPRLPAGGADRTLENAEGFGGGDQCRRRGVADDSGHGGGSFDDGHQWVPFTSARTGRR